MVAVKITRISNSKNVLWKIIKFGIEFLLINVSKMIYRIIFTITHICTIRQDPVFCNGNSVFVGWQVKREHITTNVWCSKTIDFPENLEITQLGVQGKS